MDGFLFSFCLVFATKKSSIFVTICVIAFRSKTKNVMLKNAVNLIIIPMSKCGFEHKLA